MRNMVNARGLLLVALSLTVITFVISSCHAHYGGKDKASTDPEVLLPQGNIRGLNIETNHGRVIRGFKRIPFAEAPIGNLRFRAPRPAAGWNGTLDATKDAEMCPQVVAGEVIGDEDCLYLNVYTPQLPSTDSKPMAVMVWIFGGAFSRGTGDSIEAGPQYLLDKDVVLVVPNYRLGPLGFLCTGDEVSPGNNGMKDQVLALKWVQENIEYFGGDPDRVMLFGVSAGAASANLLALSGLAAGLFHNYIKISGAALSRRAYVPRDTIVRHSYLLGEHLGCPTTSSTALVHCLRALETAKLVNITTLFVKWDKYPDILWRPTDEPNSEGAFLTDSPKNLYAAGKIRDLPCISGLVRDEGLYYSNRFYEDSNLFNDFLNNIDMALPYILLYHDHEDVEAQTAAIKEFYFNDLTADREVLLANLTQVIGDVYYIHPTYSAHQMQFALGKSPQYLYSFEYLRTNKYSDDSPIYRGIQHADDEPFLFGIVPSSCEERLTYCELSDADREMIDIVVGLQTSFASSGIPSLDLENAVIWEPYSSEDNYLRIGDGSKVTLEMKHSYLRERIQFWDHLLSHSE